jgi:hypothetical protein
MAEKDGSFTINVEGGTVSSPPHIVNSGASVIIKELTNQEILSVWHKVWYEQNGTIFDFAKEILKKAKEK